MAKSAATKVETPRTEEWTEERIQQYRDETKALAHNLDTGYMQLAERLYNIFDIPAPGDTAGRALYEVWGFQNIGDYAEQELCIHRKKAQRLRGIWYRLCVELSGMDPAVRDRIVALGFAKVRELIRVLTVENAEEWAERAEEENFETLSQSVRNFLDNVEAARQKAISEGKDPSEVEPDLPTPEVLQYETFPLYEDQHKIVESAIQRASELSGSDKRGHNLTLICTDFLATNDFLTGDETQRIGYLQKIENVLGVRLVACDKKSGDLIHGLDNLEKMQARYAPGAESRVPVEEKAEEKAEEETEEKGNF